MCRVSIEFHFYQMFSVQTWAQNDIAEFKRQLESAVRSYQSGDRQAAMQDFSYQ